jgi:hypothetical protein
MSKKAKTPRPKKAKPFPLKSSTCAQLLAWLESTPDEKERKHDLLLRGHYESAQNRRLLALCGPLKASHHRAWCLTARHLANVPTLTLTATGGKPKASSMPPFTANLKKIGAINGLVIHRFGKGAFIRNPIPCKNVHIPEDGEKLASKDLFSERVARGE